MAELQIDTSVANTASIPNSAPSMEWDPAAYEQEDASSNQASRAASPFPTYNDSDFQPSPGYTPGAPGSEFPFPATGSRLPLVRRHPQFGMLVRSVGPGNQTIYLPLSEVRRSQHPLQGPVHDGTVSGFGTGPPPSYTHDPVDNPSVLVSPPAMDEGQDFQTSTSSQTGNSPPSDQPPIQGYMVPRQPGTAACHTTAFSYPHADLGQPSHDRPEHQSAYPSIRGGNLPMPKPLSPEMRDAYDFWSQLPADLSASPPGSLTPYVAGYEEEDAAGGGGEGVKHDESPK
ncbi:hypothetical protein IAT38_007123 [Cryptococcus sp. DSM 104549]